MALTLLSFVLFTAAAVVADNKEFINCTVDETPVPEGSFVSIKCKFPFDIATTKQNFSVSRTNTGVTIDVVTCKWNSTAGKHICSDKGTGYLVQNITSEVRILILRATPTQTGNYTCHVANGSIPANPCVLVVTEVPFKTSCSAPQVQKGATVEVICEFNKNLKQLKAEFLVVKQPLLAHGNENESAVIDCSWKGDKPECNNQNGYTIGESAVTSTFILTINGTISEQEGRYTCRAHSSLQSDETPCEFNFKAATTTTSTTTTTPTTTTTTPAGAQTEMTDWHSGMLKAIISCVTILPIVCIVTLVAIFYLKNRRQNNRDDVHYQPASGVEPTGNLQIQ